MIKNNRLSAASIALICSISISGCYNYAAVAGKFINKNLPEEHTELKTDGTFVIHQTNMDAKGKYSVDDNDLLLTLDNGEELKDRIEGNIIVGNNGNRSIKVE